MIESYEKTKFAQVTARRIGRVAAALWSADDDQMPNSVVEICDHIVSFYSQATRELLAEFPERIEPALESIRKAFFEAVGFFRESDLRPQVDPLHVPAIIDRLLSEPESFLSIEELWQKHATFLTDLPYRLSILDEQVASESLEDFALEYGQLLGLCFGEHAYEEADNLAGLVSLQASYIVAFTESLHTDLRESIRRLLIAHVGSGAVSVETTTPSNLMTRERAQQAIDDVIGFLSAGWERLADWHKQDRGDRDFSAPDQGALEVVQRLVDRDPTVELEQLRHVASEYGRLLGPLVIDASEPPIFVLDSMTAIPKALATAFQAGKLESGLPRAFDEQKHEFYTLTVDAIEAQLEEAFLDGHKNGRHAFFEWFDSGDLPENSEERYEEQERRSAERAHAKERAQRATSLISDPLQAMVEAVVAETGELSRLQSADAPMNLPAAQPYGVSPLGAENWVSDALRALGVPEATVTQQTGDGGVDIISERYAVSVKHYRGSVPVEEVREILGVATVLKKIPMLWTSGTLTEAGAEFANLAPVLVFNYAVETAKITALNRPAQAFLDTEGETELD